MVVVSPDHDSGPGPLVAVPAGWTLERIVADDALERHSQPSSTSADLLIVVGAPALGVRIAAATEARLMLADATERKISLPQPGAASTRCVTLPGVALDGGGMVEAVIDAGRPQRARRVRLAPGAFRFTLIDRT